MTENNKTQCFREYCSCSLASEQYHYLIWEAAEGSFYLQTLGSSLALPQRFLVPRESLLWGP